LARGLRSCRQTTLEASAARGAASTRHAAFLFRQERALVATGRANAAAISRVEAPLPDEDGGEEDEEDGEDEKHDGGAGRDGGGGGGGGGGDGDGASVAASVASRAASLHPSLAGSSAARSAACSEATVGAGDATLYWAVKHRVVVAQDLGHTCRECKAPFGSLGAPLTERRGARTSSRYHAACFSGFADPRSQAGSSAHVGALAGTQLAAAPSGRTHKMRTSSHFSLRGAGGGVGGGAGGGAGGGGAGGGGGGGSGGGSNGLAFR